MKKLILLLIAACVAMTQIAAAEDLMPPSWRGQLGTTSQVWEFESPMVPGATFFYAPDGPATGGLPPLPSTKIYWLTGSSPIDYWLNSDAGRSGVVPLSGSLDITVDNYDPHPDNIKLIWLQLTWRPQELGSEPFFIDFDPLPTLPPVLIDEIPLNLDWKQSTYAWQLDWNPPDEQIILGGNINVDELVIDTWCVPEPTTICILGLGALSLLRKQKNS
ncbi:MAG: PEP-CTERM sorting domain-containing protein [Phycisphaerae bacterium]|nr:PEP-CTERM sorting domain-containing protein [Phycisphaerae bacterium]